MDRIATLDMMIQRCLLFLTTIMSMTTSELQENVKNGNLSFLGFAMARLQYYIETRMGLSDDQSWEHHKNLINVK